MTRQLSLETSSGNPAADYERYFVPAIGAPLAQELIATAELDPGDRVLDLACGTGVVARHAAQWVGNRGTISGVDASPGMLEVARRMPGAAAVAWHEASAEELPLEDGSFDVALCQMGLQFFRDRIAAVRELRRVLRPGGRVALNVPGPMPALFAVLEAALERHLGDEAAAFVSLVFSLHDPGELQALLASEGFTDVRARSRRRSLQLPPARDFLWEYIASTPLAGAAASLDEDRRVELEREVVAAWSEFAGADGLVLDVDVTTATGRA